MKNSYPTAIKSVLAHEGGYTNHPADPGGPTNWGITIADARMYWKSTATAADVKAMPLSVAQDIYKKRYWDAQRCDELPAGLDYSVFDYGVNSGIGRSGKVLRRILGLSDATSAVTQEVLDAVAKRDTKSLIVAMNDERLRFLKSLRTWPTFGGGWGRRVAEVKALSLQLAGGKAQATPTPVTETMAKGEQTKPVAAAPAKDAAKDAGKKGIFALIVAGIVATFTWLLDHPALAIGATVVLVAAGVFGWRWWKHHRAASGATQPQAIGTDAAVAETPSAPATPTPAPSARRAPRKPAAKPKAKKTAKRKPAKRKAA
jgi:lysozyme family protein